MVDLDPLEDGEKGVIINTASVAAEDGQIGQAAYSASKGGVLAMALPIARDLMNEGMRVNTILPGVFKTPMVAMMPPNVQDALGAQVPFPKRLGKPEEYAQLACFLIENAYMNADCGPARRRNPDGAALMCEYGEAPRRHRRGGARGGRSDPRDRAARIRGRAEARFVAGHRSRPRGRADHPRGAGPRRAGRSGDRRGRSRRRPHPCA